MATVNLQAITPDNGLECLRLQVEPAQAHVGATNAQSLAEAKADPTLVPLALDDRAALGYLPPPIPGPLVGCIRDELQGKVGFILRLMIARTQPRRGDGRAAVLEVIRRLKRTPEVQLIAPSHPRGNEASANVFRSLGGVPWEIAWAQEPETEVFLRLDETWSFLGTCGGPEQGSGADGQKRPLLRRSRFRQPLTAGVRLLISSITVVILST